MKLRKCPNCGETKIVFQHNIDPCRFGFYANCTQCNWFGATRLTKFLAGLSWNRQARRRASKTLKPQREYWAFMK